MSSIAFSYFYNLSIVKHTGHRYTSESNLVTKYTYHGGKRSFKGWAREGKKEYNRLCQLVSQVRSRRKVIESKLLFVWSPHQQKLNKHKPNVTPTDVIPDDEEIELYKDDLMRIMAV